MKTYGGVEAIHIQTSTLKGGGKRHVPAVLRPRNTNSAPIQGGSVGPRARPVALEKTKISRL